jgi:uncharacterized protein (DUF983 family)
MPYSVRLLSRTILPVPPFYRCVCGRLYKDYSGTAQQCQQCHASIRDEYEQQERDDMEANDEH